jgi:hypothetical protein
MVAAGSAFLTWLALFLGGSAKAWETRTLLPAPERLLALAGLAQLEQLEGAFFLFWAWWGESDQRVNRRAKVI